MGEDGPLLGKQLFLLSVSAGYVSQVNQPVMSLKCFNQL